MKKSINDRCPLQIECERKKCEFVNKELECPYYSANAREGYYIEDQEKIRNRQFREHWEHDTVAFLESLKNNGDDKNNCSCQSCKQPDCICAGMQDAEGRADCDGDNNCRQSGCTYAVKHRAALAIVNSYPESEQASIVLIPVEQLYPHPDNPRKDLGDLTELADSIKATGVLQNLTVVPRTVTGEITGETWQKGYTVVIGHRRLAASKLAGMKELPCVVSDMSLQEQVRTMLMENMQRTDLTIYEQAQGFQMMLNLGDSIDEIARKSGFSQTTVRRRVKLLELDQEKFKASVDRGANLMDYMELDKIDDSELKNEVLEAIGTNNFRQKLASAIETEKSRKLIAERVQALSAFATQVEKTDHSTMRYVRNYGIWNKKDEVTRPDDADTVAYFFYVGMNQVDLYRQIVEEPEDTEAEARAERIKAELERRHAELETVSRAAYQARYAFIKNFAAAKKNVATVCRFAAGMLLRCHDDPDDAMMSELLGIGVDTENDEIDTTAFDERSKESPEYTLLTTAYASFDAEGVNYFWWHWDATKGSMVCTYDKNEHLDFLYEILTELGYEMSDEEKALQAGTHELFVRSTT